MFTFFLFVLQTFCKRETFQIPVEETFYYDVSLLREAKKKKKQKYKIINYENNSIKKTNNQM